MTIDNISKTALENPSLAARSIEQYVHIRDEKAVTVNGGTFTQDVWQKRDLNTVISDTDKLASLATSQITLQPGVYHCRALAPSFKVNGNQLRLQNITAGRTELLGTSGVRTEASGNEAIHSHLAGRFNIQVVTVFELQHQCQATRAADGLGVSADITTEVYAEIEFIRVGDSF